MHRCSSRRFSIGKSISSLEIGLYPFYEETNQRMNSRFFKQTYFICKGNKITMRVYHVNMLYGANVIQESMGIYNNAYLHDSQVRMCILCSQHAAHWTYEFQSAAAAIYSSKQGGGYLYISQN